jgi:hypothetical protein
MIETKELNKFYKEIQEEIKSSLISEEDGASPEQLFTEYALAILAENGETENYRVSYDEKISKRGTEHKVNGYALYENYETLDLFISIYNLSEDIQTIPKPDADKALDRLTKFFRNTIYKDYVNEIEESSEIFDLAQTLTNVKEVNEYLTRVNIFLITNGEIKSETPHSTKVAGYPVFYRIIDIHYLYNLSEKLGIPIEINFAENQVTIPCIEDFNDNEDYQSYLAIIPGHALAIIYEQYGPRLLEQNVRSFLQFTGKINKGIRKTILEEPHMFLAFNNGIAATAEEIRLIDIPDKKGKAIEYVKDFQIVNGGQTTASIYHTWKKNNADISKIFVQLKLTIIKDRENFGEIVGRIAEYANTQNKVSSSDLSSNRENLVILEKLSRTIWAPPKEGEVHQTRWFFERSRGQYRNEKSRFGITPSRRKQFEKQNPRKQMFTKEQLAKYLNTYKEVYKGKKLVIGPHIVVRGSQKNYSQFLNYNFEDKPDNIFFEDAVALAIIFKTAEQIYGVKPNALGDMRYITVPYTIAWISYKLNYTIDLYKIWKKQQISNELSDILLEAMLKVEEFIKQNAPGSLYGEWAKKEDCWGKLKATNFSISLDAMKNDLLSNDSGNRRKLTREDTDQAEIEASLERIKSIHPKTWRKIEEWGRETSKFSQYQIDMANTLGKRIKSNRAISEIERKQGEEILNKIADENPELFFDMEDFFEEDENKRQNEEEVTLDLVKKIVQWDKRNKRLKPYEYRFMSDIAEGKKSMTSRNLFIVDLNLKKVRKYGFSD